MIKHPYPKHVVNGVAKALMKSSENRDAFGAGGDWDAAGHTIKQEFVDHANTALQALWDASRVDRLEDLPENVVVIDNDNAVEVDNTQTNNLIDYDFASDFPVHIIHWGDSD